MTKSLLWPLSAGALLLSTGVLHAEPRLEGLAGAGLAFRHTSAANLAEIAGTPGFAAGNDMSPGALGMELRAGVLFPFQLELGATTALSVGGLNLSHVEERYLGSQPEPLGSSLSLSGDFAARFAPALSTDTRLFVGPVVGYERMAASSPAGAAHLDLLGVGFGAGVRQHINTISRVVDGHLELALAVRREIPVSLLVEHSANDVVFSGTGGSAGAIYSLGATLSYVFSFHDTD